MDYREASVCFFKMSNLRRNVIGRGGAEGAQRGRRDGGILFFVLHLVLLLFTDSVNCTTPPVPETKTANYSVYFCLCILLVAQ